MYNWLLVVLFFIAFHFLHGSHTKSVNNNYRFNFSSLPELMEGDIVFRRGISTESYAVMAIDGNTRYSHVGVIHKNQEGKIGVVHIEPGDRYPDNTIRFEPLEIFWDKKRASKGGIYRTLLDDQKKENISSYLERVIEERVKFDDGYNLFDTSKIYCTELLYHAFQCGGIEITKGVLDTLLFPKRKPIIFPGTILRNRDLQTIFLYYTN
jgi:hypothetical protein